ncbi:hypothetical protein BGAL_0053g00130 [Botrytis galanthina]|uniref:Uncharacterized protein n=1 Tax=Botrytis galanthina TaxID=278940 RepID=A0A4S8RAC1_9HELO|nr:hypothetical protein BGAL_0053g00130 [Botrytis galanthina]
MESEVGGRSAAGSLLGEHGKKVGATRAIRLEGIFAMDPSIRSGATGRTQVVLVIVTAYLSGKSE